MVPYRGGCEILFHAGQWNWLDEADGYPASSFTHDYTFDFFNYAGLHRPVFLYTVPKMVHVSDVTTSSTVSQDLQRYTAQTLDSVHLYQL